MTIKNILNDALKTPMSRREFLGQVGAVLLAVIGVTAIMHALSVHRGLSNDRVVVGEGYGALPYGGATAARSNQDAA